MTAKTVLFLSLFFLCTFFYGQKTYKEVAPQSHIKSIVFKGPTEDQFPIAQLGEIISLEFDDITASEEDYYYKIIHCDYNWTQSELLKSQYIKGLDNQRIFEYNNSYSTLQSYSNYRLTIPNNNTKLKVSGNYVLEIYNSTDELQFSRRFLIYQNNVKVGVTIKRSRDFEFLNTKQVVQFSINAETTQIVNPKKEVKVAIIQNYYWPSTITNIKPQYLLGNLLSYKYDQETSFYGGNEFLYFDTKDLRAPSSAIQRIGLDELYHHYLFTNAQRLNKDYTYFPDINGDFVIRTLQGSDASTEAEYTKVHFSVPYSENLGLQEVYVFGKFNNYALNKDNLMSFNDKTGNMEATITMKQGFYNYKYVLKKDNNEVDLNIISGTSHFTENHYLVLVYYRQFGQRYDSLIGIGTANSSNISN